MMEPEVSEREEEVTRVGPDGSDQRTVTRTTSTTAGVGLRLKNLVWLAAGVVDVILVLDFIFKLVGAANVGFVAFIADIAGALAAPFRGVAASAVNGTHYAYWPDVVGIVIYAILAAIVVSLVGILAARRPAPTAGRRPAA